MTVAYAVMYGSQGAAIRKSDTIDGAQLMQDPDTHLDHGPNSPTGSWMTPYLGPQPHQRRRDLVEMSLQRLFQQSTPETQERTVGTMRAGRKLVLELQPRAWIKGRPKRAGTWSNCRAKNW